MRNYGYEYEYIVNSITETVIVISETDASLVTSYIIYIWHSFKVHLYLPVVVCSDCIVVCSIVVVSSRCVEIGLDVVVSSVVGISFSVVAMEPSIH